MLVSETSAEELHEFNGHAIVQKLAQDETGKDHWKRQGRRRVQLHRSVGGGGGKAVVTMIDEESGKEPITLSDVRSCTIHPTARDAKAILLEAIAIRKQRTLTTCVLIFESTAEAADFMKLCNRRSASAGTSAARVARRMCDDLFTRGIYTDERRQPVATSEKKKQSFVNEVRHANGNGGALIHWLLSTVPAASVLSPLQKTAAREISPTIFAALLHHYDSGAEEAAIAVATNIVAASIDDRGSAAAALPTRESIARSAGALAMNTTVALWSSVNRVVLWLGRSSRLLIRWRDAVAHCKIATFSSSPHELQALCDMTGTSCDTMDSTETLRRLERQTQQLETSSGTAAPLTDAALESAVYAQCTQSLIARADILLELLPTSLSSADAAAAMVSDGEGPVASGSSLFLKSSVPAKLRRSQSELPRSAATKSVVASQAVPIAATNSAAAAAEEAESPGAARPLRRQASWVALERHSTWRNLDKTTQQWQRGGGARSGSPKHAVSKLVEFLRSAMPLSEVRELRSVLRSRHRSARMRSVGLRSVSSMLTSSRAILAQEMLLSPIASVLSRGTWNQLGSTKQQDTVSALALSISNVFSASAGLKIHPRDDLEGCGMDAMDGVCVEFHAMIRSLVQIIDPAVEAENAVELEAGSLSGGTAALHSLKMLAMRCCCSVDWRREDAALLTKSGLLSALQKLMLNQSSRSVVLVAFENLAEGCFGWSESEMETAETAAACDDDSPCEYGAIADLHHRLCDTILVQLNLDLTNLERVSTTGGEMSSAENDRYWQDERACFALAKLLLGALRRKSTKTLDVQRALLIVNRLLLSCSCRLQLIAAQILSPLTQLCCSGGVGIDARGELTRWLQYVGALLCGEGKICATRGSSSESRNQLYAPSVLPTGGEGGEEGSSSTVPLFQLVIHPTAEYSSGRILEQIHKRYQSDLQERKAPLDFGVDDTDPHGDAMTMVWKDLHDRLVAVEKQCEAMGYGCGRGVVLVTHKNRKKLNDYAKRYCTDAPGGINCSVMEDRIQNVRRCNLALKAKSNGSTFQHSGYGRMQVASELLRVLRTTLRGEEEETGIMSDDDDECGGDGGEEGALQWSDVLGDVIHETLIAHLAKLGDGGSTHEARLALGCVAVLGGDNLLEVCRPGGRCLALISGSLQRATLVTFESGRRLATVVLEDGGSESSSVPVPVPVQDLQPIAAVTLGGAASFALTRDRLTSLVEFLELTKEGADESGRIADSTAWIVLAARALVVETIFNLCAGDNVAGINARRCLLSGCVPTALRVISSIASKFVTSAPVGLESADCASLSMRRALMRGLDCKLSRAMCEVSGTSLVPFQLDARDHCASALQLVDVDDLEYPWMTFPTRWNMTFGEGFWFPSPTVVQAMPRVNRDGNGDIDVREEEPNVAAVVVADCPIPLAEVYYFEITVEDSKETSCGEEDPQLMIGLFPEALLPNGGGPRQGAPRLRCGPGARFICANEGKKVWWDAERGVRCSAVYAKQGFDKDDTVGVLWDMERGRVYFSINGALGPCAFEGDDLKCALDKDSHYRPCAVLSRNYYSCESALLGRAVARPLYERVRANFGGSDFVYVKGISSSSLGILPVPPSPLDEVASSSLSSSAVSAPSLSSPALSNEIWERVSKMGEPQTAPATPSSSSSSSSSSFDEETKIWSDAMAEEAKRYDSRASGFTWHDSVFEDASWSSPAAVGERNDRAVAERLHEWLHECATILLQQHSGGNGNESSREALRDLARMAVENPGGITDELKVIGQRFGIQNLPLPAKDLYSRDRDEFGSPLPAMAEELVGARVMISRPSSTRSGYGGSDCSAIASRSVWTPELEKLNRRCGVIEAVDILYDVALVLVDDSERAVAERWWFPSSTLRLVDNGNSDGITTWNHAGFPSNNVNPLLDEIEAAAPAAALNGLRLFLQREQRSQSVPEILDALHLSTLEAPLRVFRAGGRRAPEVTLPALLSLLRSESESGGCSGDISRTDQVYCRLYQAAINARACTEAEYAVREIWDMSISTVRTVKVDLDLSNETASYPHPHEERAQFVVNFMKKATYLMPWLSLEVRSAGGGGQSSNFTPGRLLHSSTGLSKQASPVLLNSQRMWIAARNAHAQDLRDCVGEHTLHHSFNVETAIDVDVVGPSIARVVQIGDVLLKQAEWLRGRRRNDEGEGDGDTVFADGGGEDDSKAFERRLDRLIDIFAALAFQIGTPSLVKEALFKLLTRCLRLRPIAIAVPDIKHSMTTARMMLMRAAPRLLKEAETLHESEFPPQKAVMVPLDVVEETIDGVHIRVPKSDGNIQLIGGQMHVAPSEGQDSMTLRVELDVPLPADPNVTCFMPPARRDTRPLRNADAHIGEYKFVVAVIDTTHFDVTVTRTDAHGGWNRAFAVVWRVCAGETSIEELTERGAWLYKDVSNNGIGIRHSADYPGVFLFSLYHVTEDFIILMTFFHDYYFGRCALQFVGRRRELHAPR